MQCTSYIPVYYHARDLNLGASGVSWNLFDSNTSHGEERGYNISLPLCDTNQNLGYDKAVLRQIMQNHEATFRYQVQELHRLYRRQRELMDEMKMRNIYAQDLQSQRPDISQTTSHATSWIIGYSSHSNLSEITAEIIHRPPNFAATNFQEHTAVRPSPFERRNSYNEVKFLSSRSKGDEKCFDLELPADAYHDDNGKLFKEGNPSEAPESACSSPKKNPIIQPAIDSGDLSSFNLNSTKTSFFDLNEPIQIESLPSNSTVSVEAIPQSVVTEHTQLLNHDDSSDGIKCSVAIDLNCTPVSCFADPEITPENLQTVSKETTVVLDCSAAQDHAMTKGKCVEDHPVVVHNKVNDKFLKTETYIDLNSAAVVEEPSAPLSSSIPAIKSAGDIDLEGPVSPENEECSPPRGKSEDILLSEQGEGELAMDLDTIAAQTLVGISSSGIQEYTNSLCWFAEIVSFVGDDLMNVAADNDQDKLLSDGVYDFQENAPYFSHGVKKERETILSSSGVDPTRGRGARKRKDFQTESLHSNASLLRKNLDTIEEFLETGSLRRNAGKKACPKPRKYSKLSSSSDVVKKSKTATRSKEGFIQGWGKIRKRRGARSRRAGNFLAIG